MLFIWRGSGILVPIFLFINGWIVSQFYTDHTLGNVKADAWICFYTAIIVLLHGLLVYPWKPVAQDGTVINADGSQEEMQSPGSIWHHSFFYIPVIFWGLIFAGLSVVFFISGNSKDDITELPATSEMLVEAVPQRSVFLFNPTDDTMHYVISGEDFYMDTILEPNTFTHQDLDAGNYIFAGFDKANEALLRIPAEGIYNDVTKCKLVTKDGKETHRRILRPATQSEADFDDAWIILDGVHNMLVVDVTSICKSGLTEADVKNTNWTSMIKQKFDASDIMEPLYGNDPGANQFTVLNMSDDIPSKIESNEKVFMLLSVIAGKELTNEYLAQRILIFCPTLQSN